MALDLWWAPKNSTGKCGVEALDLEGFPKRRTKRNRGPQNHPTCVTNLSFLMGARYPQVYIQILENFIRDHHSISQLNDYHLSLVIITEDTVMGIPITADTGDSIYVARAKWKDDEMLGATIASGLSGFARCFLGVKRCYPLVNI